MWSISVKKQQSLLFNYIIKTAVLPQFLEAKINQADFPFYASATVSTIWWLLSASYLGRLVVCPMHYSQCFHFAICSSQCTPHKSIDKTMVVCSSHYTQCLLTTSVSCLTTLLWALLCSLHTKLYYEESAPYAHCTLDDPLKHKNQATQ